MSVSGQSKSSYHSAAHREKLLKLQQKQDLSGQIVSKLLHKYRNRRRSFIEREVASILQAPLTEENLRALDQKIQAGSSVSRSNASQANSLISGVSVRTGASQPGESAGPPLSPSDVSYMSGASRLSSSSKFSCDQRSVASSISRVSSEVLPPNKDEWAVILEYNAVVHREEVQNKLLREKDQKLALKRELDQQIEEKNRRKQQEREDAEEYNLIQDRNLAELEDNERRKTALYQAKLLQEKELRAKQLREVKKQRRNKQKQEHEMQSAIVKRQQQEYEEELSAIRARKDEEHHQRQKMIQENEANKQLKKQQEHSNRAEDIRLQHAYAEMSDKIEQDRLGELKAREDRIQCFMDNMAQNVLQEQDQMNRQEDERLLNFNLQAVEHDRKEQERQLARSKQQKAEMREELTRQIEEKTAKKRKEKELHNMQAEIWKSENEKHHQIEQELKQEREKAYAQWAEELRKQAEEKRESYVNRMDYVERALNKELLRNVVATVAEIPLVKLSKKDNT